MRIFFIILLFATIANNAFSQSAATPAKGDKYVLVIHGGAGYTQKANTSAEREKLYFDALKSSLQAGYTIINKGGSSLDAVVAAIKILEDDSLFNAGKGAVFSHDGRNELDASIMDGKSLKAGAVAGVTTIKNPIDAARLVMDSSRHVMMARDGAEAFWRSFGRAEVPNEYFRTVNGWNDFLKRREQEKKKAEKDKSFHPLDKDHKFGTVGAVALDKEGNLAAGTSTGGMSDKKFGRVGDSPIIGAGTFADNNTVAVSGTGWGEHFIRNVVAYDVSANMEYRGYTVEQALASTLKKLEKTGGEGGMIALDKNGRAAWDFDTRGMFRAAITAEGKMIIELYGK